MYLNDGGSKEIWVVGRGVSDWQVLGLSEVEKYFFPILYAFIKFVNDFSFFPYEIF